MLVIMEQSFSFVRCSRNCSLDQNGTSTTETLQAEDSIVMGSTKDLHEDDDNAITMPTLPERNHKKRTLQLFWCYDGHRYCLLLQRLRHYPCQYLSKRQRFVLLVDGVEFN
jgi:hypothetical protein